MLYTIADPGQDATGHLATAGSCLCPVSVSQNHQVLLHWAAFQPLCPKVIVLNGVILIQEQDPALDIFEPQKWPWLVDRSSSDPSGEPSYPQAVQ